MTKPCRNPDARIKPIVRCFEQVVAISGWRIPEIYDDWLTLVDATLDMLPAHVASCAAGRGILPQSGDSPEAQAVWARLAERYGEQWFKTAGFFTDAFQHMLTLSDEWFDWLGHIYMTLHIGNVARGQYFTPFELCLAIAQINDPSELLYARIKEACQHPDNHLGAAAVLTGLTCQTAEEAQAWFEQRIVPAALPFVESVTVCDPALTLPPLKAAIVSSNLLSTSWR